MNKTTTTPSVIPYSLFTDYDINLWKAGRLFRAYDKLGSHVLKVDGHEGNLLRRMGT